MNDNKNLKTGLVEVFLLVAMLLFTGCGGSGNLRIDNSPTSKDGVTVTLEKATARRMRDPDRYEYAFSGTIENTTDEGIMQVIYTFALLDKDGNEFRSFGEVYDGENESIPPHQKIDFALDGIKWGAQDVPSSVSVGVSTVMTETELPAEQIPQPGDYLYQILGDEKLANIRETPPAELSFHIDQGGYGRTATFTKGEELDKAVDLLCGIRIAGETEEMVTDNYNWIRLVWEDGSESYISLNLRNLEHSIHSIPHIYRLENLEAFWSYAEGFVVEDDE